MHLIDDIDRVLADLRRDTYLVDERADILYGVVGRRIEFVNIKRPLLIECLARLAFIASIETILRIEAVDGFGKDTRASGLSYSSRSAEQICMRQVILTYRILQRLCERLLTDYRFKSLRPILTR